MEIENIESDKKLIIIDYFLPWESTKDQKLSEMLQRSNVIPRNRHMTGSYRHCYIGLPSQKAGTICHNNQIPPLCEKRSSIPIHPPVNIRNGHNSYCEDMLQVVFYCSKFDIKTFDCGRLFDNWTDFCGLNKLFLNAILSLYKPGDLILIINHRFFLLPYMIAKYVMNPHIGFYLDLPFPDPEILRLLPQRKELLKGLLSSDFLVFQDYWDHQHFFESCEMFLHLDYKDGQIKTGTKSCSTGVFQMGVNMGQILKIMKHSLFKSFSSKFQKTFNGNKIIVCSESNYSYQEVSHEIQSFEIFLSKYKEWLGKVHLVHIRLKYETTPEDTRVADMISSINARYGSVGYTPVYYFGNIGYVEYISLLSLANICMIASEKDGVNLLIDEFVVCQKDGHGLVIVSEFVSNSNYVKTFFRINPFDHEGIADKIHSTLNISKNARKNLYGDLLNIVSTNSTRGVYEFFTMELEKTFERKEAETRCLDVTEFVTCYKQSSKRLFVLDYDGTLVPIVKRPELAKPSERVIELLKNLSEDPKNQLFVVSGRKADDLEGWLGSIHKSIGFGAEHGCSVRCPNSLAWVDSIQSNDRSWRDKVMQVLKTVTDEVSGSFIEEKKWSITWHYRLSDAKTASKYTEICKDRLGAVISGFPLKLSEGKKNIEVRQLFDKGSMVERLTEEYNGVDFVFCAGDDSTDEDMFRVVDNWEVSNAFTCRVGDNGCTTTAKYICKSVDHVVDLLTRLESLSQNK